MDYKKIIQSQKLRIIILKCLYFIPDTLMLKLQYRISTGRKLSLKNPVRFTEKIQWYKLFYHDKNIRQCSDKLLVRNYVSELGYGHILVPLYFYKTEIKDIDINILPNRSVLKPSIGGGGKDLIFINKTSKPNDKEIKKKMKSWNLGFIKNSISREWGYVNNTSVILCEKDINDNDNIIGDFKFYCFSGIPKYFLVVLDRFSK
jgi:hypothetical protein